MFNKELKEGIIKSAKTSLEECAKSKGNFLPVLMINSGDKKDSVLFGMANGDIDNKGDIIKQIGKQVNNMGIKVKNICMVADTYYLKQDKKDSKMDLSVRPSQSKDRREALTIAYQQVGDSKDVMIMLPYKRSNGGKIEWEEIPKQSKGNTVELNLLGNFWQGYI